MRRSPLLLLALGGLWAGCGDDDEPRGRAVTVPAGAVVRVAADEYSFDPARVTVDGGRVRFEVVNEGDLAHNLKVQRAGDTIGGTPTSRTGQRRVANVDLPTGSYRLVCTVGDHAELGMTGTLRIRRR